MAESEADAWEKVREMVRNSPPGTAQPPWTPDAVVPRPPPRRWLRGLVIAVLLLVAAGGAYFGWLQIMRPSADERSPAAAGPAREQKSAASPSAPDVPATPQPVGASAGEFATIKRGMKGINVRSAGSPTSASVARLSAGDRVEKIGEDGAWIHIRFDNRGKRTEGWVRRDLLE